MVKVRKGSPAIQGADLRPSDFPTLFQQNRRTIKNKIKRYGATIIATHTYTAKDARKRRLDDNRHLTDTRTCPSRDSLPESRVGARTLNEYDPGCLP